MPKTVLALVVILVVLLASGCAATPAAVTPPAPTVTAVSATAATEPRSTVEASGATDEVVVIIRRHGGFAGVDESWTLYGDGRVVDAAGAGTAVDAAAVTALVEQARAAGFFEQTLGLPKMSACRDCFTYELTVRAGDRENTIACEDAQVGVSQATWELLAAAQSLAQSGR